MLVERCAQLPGLLSCRDQLTSLEWSGFAAVDRRSSKRDERARLRLWLRLRHQIISKSNVYRRDRTKNKIKENLVYSFPSGWPSGAEKRNPADLDRCSQLIQLREPVPCTLVSLLVSRFHFLRPTLSTVFFWSAQTDRKVR